MAWFLARGFHYLSDELVILTDRAETEGFWRPILPKAGAVDTIAAIAPECLGATGPAARPVILPAGAADYHGLRPCALVIFPIFERDAELSVGSLSPAECGLRLMACNLNGRNLADHGFTSITGLARNVPAILLRYGAYHQLDGVVDILARTIVENEIDAPGSRRLLAAIAGHERSTVHRWHGVPGRQQAQAMPIPAATPGKLARKLTIGMSTYDDYDGVYFTLQALRLYHSEVVDELELIVVDNHPNGRGAEALKKLEKAIPNYRYLPFEAQTGTASRDLVIREAGSDFVLCMDCHVFVVPGAIRRLIDYFAINPESLDLIQGPMVYDDLTNFASHLEPAWRAGMFGTWATDSAAADPDGAPFEIKMHGLGLFACRRGAWPGFNAKFRGFGGEEGYIHEKFRRGGGRVLCLPFLRWIHRFERPLGVPYPNTWEDRIHNYLVGFVELGLPTDDLEAHFAELLGEATAMRIIRQIRSEIEQAH